MKNTKTIGFYIALLAGIIGIVSLIRFSLWAPAHNSSDIIITAALVTGILMDLLLFFTDHGLILVLATAAYTVAMAKLLANSVGSFVDAFQGIVMFGDATQVGTIISIAGVMAVSVVLSIITSFMRQRR